MVSMLHGKDAHMDEPMTLAARQAFFQRYDTFVRDRTRLRLHAFTARFDHMKVALHALKTALYKLNTYRARAFNLFRLLRIERNEVATHSVVLADLLSPYGTHGQGYLFLRTFLHYCAEKWAGMFPCLHGDIESAVWFVDREKITAFGKLDLVISCPDLHFLLVIENKIDAGEQPNQLQRYAQWMDSQRVYFPKRVLLYLTPQGTPSRTAGRHSYVSLSYRHDIFQWLCAA